MSNEPNFFIDLPDTLSVDRYIDPDKLRMFEDNDLGYGLSRRVIYITGTINDTGSGEQFVNTGDIVNLIQRYNAIDTKANIPVEKRKPIWIAISSSGGDMFGTWTLINTMKSSKTPIYTVNVGDAFSAACLVLLSGHKRFSLRGTNHLIHSGSISYGGQKEIAESAKKYMDKLDKKAQDWLIDRTKIDLKTYKSKAPKDLWMDEEDALKYGVIDVVVDDLNEVFGNP